MSKQIKRILASGITPELLANLNKASQALEKSNKRMQRVFMKRASFAGAAVSTGSLWLDYKLGGGIPSGRVIGISGAEGVGKSLLATQIAGEQLKRGGIVVYYDAEGANDPIFLKARGIDFNDYIG